MLASTSISEPFVLSSYGVPRPTDLRKDAGRSSSNVYASHAGTSGSSDGLVTVTAQGDGVHILDLSNLHPVVSQTLGPSTFFACPAVSWIASQDSKTSCTTYAAIEASSDVAPEASRRTIWIWEDDLASSSGGSRRKQEVTVSHPISRIYVSQYLGPYAVALSPKGAVSIISRDGTTQSREPLLGDHVVFRSFIYPRNSCSFLASHSSVNIGIIITLFYVLDSKIQSTFLSCDDSRTFADVGSCEIQLESERVLDVSMSTSGFVTVLYQDGSWYSYQLETTNSTTISAPLATGKLQLASLSFLTGSAAFNEVSLLSLGSSHVLLAGITAESPREIALLLWDVQYSVLLASHLLPIPSTISQSKDVSIQLNLSIAKTHALLALSPFVRSSGRKSLPAPSNLRSSILAVPFSVPAVSTIANAMGRKTSGARWLRRDGLSSSIDDGTPIGKARVQLLQSMCSAMEQNRPKAANDAFFEWRTKQMSAVSDQPNTMDDEDALLSYQVVQQLLSVILQPSKPANTPYSSEVLRYLLEQKAITTNMVEGGLLNILRLKSDWPSIELALQTVIDLSEAEVVACLRHVVTQHRQKNLPASDVQTMQVDSLQNVSSLSTFLAACIQYPMTSSSLKAAIREQFSNEDDICCLLEALEAWLKRWSQQDVSLTPANSNAQNGLDNDSNLPPLDKILSFLQCLIDATFTNLLRHRPSHRILQDIMSDIDTELVLVDQLGVLRGPLEVFAKAEAKAAREDKEGKSKKTSQTEWMRRRKQAHEQVSMAVGLYRLEELVI